MEEIGRLVLENLFSIVSAIVTIVLAPIITWFLYRNKYDAEIKQIEAKAVKVKNDGTNVLINSSETLVNSWQVFAAEMKKSYDDCAQKNEILIDRLKQLEYSLKTYKFQMEKLLDVLLAKIEKTEPEFAQTVREELFKIDSGVL